MEGVPRTRIMRAAFRSQGFAWRGKVEGSYWEKSLRGAVARRRFMAGAGSGVVAASLVAACGGGKASPERKDKSGLLTEATDSSKQARRGGTLEDSRPADVQNWD